MKIVRHACLLFLSSYVGLSYSQDYFNPLFLGNDVASLEELSYLADGGEVTPGNYYLDLYLGDNFIKNIKIQFKENTKTKRATACFTKDILKLLPINTSLTPGLNNPDIASNACIEVNQYIKDFAYQVDLSKVRISVSIPQLYLQSYRSTLADESDWDDGISAYLMNYDFSGSNSKTKGSSNYSSYYLNLNNRINLGAWRLYGNVYWTQNKYGSQTYNETKTNGVYLTRGINSIKSTLIVGQNSLGSNLFDAMPYIGATLASSNEMRPDNERGYAPPIRGIAETRSKLTIKQNDAIIYQTYVDPGPYDISDLSPVGTSGDYLVELTSVDGRVTSYSVPYSTLPNLLKENNYNYSATIGQLDITSSERRKFAQAGLSYGLPFQSTLYTGTQISSDFQSFGLGVAKDFGYLGALSVDAINSNAKVVNSDRKTGQSYRILYSKAFVDTGTNFQLAGYRYSTSGYYTFSEAARKNNRSYYIDPLTGIETPYTTTSNRSKNTFQLNVTQSLGNYGQLYAWGNVTSYWDGKDTKSIQLGWNRTFSQLNNLMVSLNYNKNTYGASTNNVFYLSLSMPLGSRSSSNQMYAANSTTYNSTDHTYTNNTSLYGNAYDNRVEYNAYQTFNKDSQNNVSNVSAAYKADFARVNFGTSYSSQTTQVNYGARGGVLLHDEGIVFTREANDTAILVKAKGAEGAKLARASENLTINQGGYALIPYATPYHYNEVELDPTSFKDNFDVQDKVKKVAPTRGAISKVVFDVEQGYNFLVSIHYKNQPIRFGTVVKGITNNSTSIANDDGTVYLTGVADKAKYTVKWDETTSCQFTINYGNNFKSSLVNKVSVNCQ